jgi:uncharacterized protein YutE (UPF0331/DUF86 family)
MELNEVLIMKRCQEISDSLERLEQIKRSSREEFLENRDFQDIASYRLLVAIEAALNLCYHVAAKKLKKAPTEYAECFGILGEGGIIPKDLALELKKLARFRDMLDHMYWKIDYGSMFDILNSSLEQLKEFSKAIMGLLPK